MTCTKCKQPGKSFYRTGRGTLMRTCSDCVKARTMARYYRTRVLKPMVLKMKPVKKIEIETTPEIKERPCAVWQGYLFAGEF